MKLIRNTKIPNRVAFGFSAVFILMISLTIVSIYRMDGVNSSLSTMNDFNSVKQRYAINFRGSVHDRAIRVRDITLVDAGERTQVLNDVSRLEQFYAASEAELDKMFATRLDMTAEERSINAEIKAAQARALPALKQVVEQQTQGALPAARDTLMGEARPAFIAWLAAINKFIDLEEKKNQEIAASVRNVTDSFQLEMILLCGCALLVGCAFAWWSISSVRPLLDLTLRVRALAAGDLSVVIPQATADDEVSQITRAVDVFKQNAIDARQAAVREAEETQAKIERATRIERDIGRFDSSVRTALDLLTASAGEMQSTAGSLAGGAQEASERSAAVAVAAEQASASVQTVAVASEEMLASIGEITRQVTKSSQIAIQAVDEADETRVTIGGLNEAAQKIGAVVRLINDIASQTNLLALNATIEAARAGEAGKGFAVVASEVKTLANQTAKATEEIAGQINSIQNATTGAVGKIAQMNATIGQMAEISTAIAAAMEEQGAATQEIARNVTHAARGTGDVTQNMVGITRTAANTGAGSNQVLKAAGALDDQANRLRTDVAEFLEKMRTS